jgi:hypothetical protein
MTDSFQQLRHEQTKRGLVNLYEVYKADPIRNGRRAYDVIWDFAKTGCTISKTHFWRLGLLALLMTSHKKWQLRYSTRQTPIYYVQQNESN